MACTYWYNGIEYTKSGIANLIRNGEVSFSNLDEAKAKSYLVNELGMKEEDIEFTAKLIDNKSLGRFTEDGKIILSSLANDSTVYHEAFHRVFNMYIDESQRKALIDEFKKRKNYKELLDSLDEQYKDLSEERKIEEFLADEFADYIINQGNIKLPTVQKSIFQKLFDFLKALIGIRNKLSIKETYQKILDGGYREGTIVNTNTMTMDAVYKVGNSNITLLGLDEIANNVVHKFMNGLVEYGKINTFLNGNLSKLDSALKYFVEDTVDDMLNLKNYVDRFNNDNLLNLVKGWSNFKKDNSFDSVVKSLTSYLKSLSKEELSNLDPSILQHLKLAFNIYNDINKPDSLVMNHIKAKLSDYGLKLTTVVNDEQDNNEEKSTLDTAEIKSESQSTGVAWDKVSFEFSADSSMSTKLKLLLSALEDNDRTTVLKLSKSYNYHDISNYLFNNLYGIPATFEDFSDRLLQLSSTESKYKNGVDQLYNMLFNNNSEDMSIVATEFISTFAKDRTEFIKTVFGKDGNFTTLEQVKAQQRQDSIAKLNNNIATVIESKGLSNWILELAQSKDLTNTLFLLGGSEVYTVSEKSDDGKINGSKLISAVQGLQSQIVNNFDKLKRTLVNDGISEEELTSKLYDYLLKSNTVKATGYISTLINEQSKANDTIELSVYNGENKKVYAITLNSYQTQLINGLNYEISKAKELFKDIEDPDLFKMKVREEVAKKYPQFMQAYNRHSLFINRMISKDNKWSMEVLVNSGVNNDRQNKDSGLTDLKRPDLGYISLNQILDPNFSYIQGMKHSDRGQLYNYKLANNSKSNYLFIKDETIFGIKSDLQYYLKQHLSDEVLRLVMLKELGIGNNIQYYNNNISVLFENELGSYDSIPEAIKIAVRDKALVDFDEAYNEFYETVLKDKLDKYIDNIALNDPYASTKQLFNQWQLFDHADKNGKPIGISDHVWNKYSESSKSPKETIERIIYAYTANGLLGNIEQSKLILGDFNFYKNAKDVPKRLAVTSSTGQLPVFGTKIEDEILKADDKFTVNGQELNYYNTPFKKNNVHNITEITFAEEDYVNSDSFKENLEPYIKNGIRQAFKIAGKEISEDELQRKVDKQIAAYNKINEPDGASWMNIFAFKEYFTRLGRWNDKLEKSFQEELKILSDPNYTGYNLEPGQSFDDVYGSFANLKLQYYGTMIPYNNTHTVDKNKANYFTVVNQGVVKSCYSILTPSQLRVIEIDNNGNISHEKRNLWYIMEQSMKQGLDVIHMGSARKIGAIFDPNKMDDPNYQKGFPRFYNTEGKVNINDNFDYEPLVQNLDWQYMKLQVESHFYQEDEIINSTQSLKNTIADILVEGIPLDVQDINAWNNYTEEQKMSNSKLYKTVKDYINVVTNQFIADLEDFKNKITTTVDGQTEENISKIANLIESALIARDATSNLIELVDNFENLTHKYIEFLPYRNRIEPVLFSTITNSVLNQKRPGSAFPQDTVQGWEVGNRNVKDGKIESNNHYKFMEVEDGKIVSEIGIVIPTAWINDLYKVYADELNSNSIDELIARVNKDIKNKDYSRIDEDLLFMKGLRIPNQSVASNDMFKIKEFFVPSNITRVVVPAQIVNKVGSDFDFDKLFTYRANTVYNPITNKLEFLRRKTDESKNEHIENIISDINTLNEQMSYPINLPTGKANMTRLNKISEAIKTALNNTVNIKSINKRSTVIQQYTEFYNHVQDLIDSVKIDKDILGKYNYETNNEKKIRQNELLTFEKQILTDPISIANLTRPTDESIIDNISKAIDKASGVDGRIEFNSKGYYLVSPAYNVWLTEVMTATKAGVGVVAVQITNNVIAKLYNLKVSDDFISGTDQDGNPIYTSTEIKLPKSNKALQTSVNSIGNFISDIISAFLTLQVDGAKNPRSVLMNMNLRTLSLASYLVRNGVSEVDVIKYLMQPAILEYNRVQDFWESNLVESKNYHNKAAEDHEIRTSELAEKHIKTLFGNTMTTLSNITSEDLDKGLRGELDNAVQLGLLDDYLRMIKVSREMSKAIRVFSPDTTKLKNMNQYNNKQEEALSLANSQFLRGFKVTDLQTKSGILQGQSLAQKAYADSYSKYYATLNGLEQLAMISKLVANSKRMNSDLKAKRETEVQNEFLSFLIQKLSPTFSEYKFENIMIGENSVGKEIEKLKKEFPDDDLLNALLVRKGYKSITIDNVKYPVDNIMLKTDSTNAEYLNHLISLVDELKETNPNLYHRLVALDIYQHGLNNSRFNISQILGLTDIEDYIQEAYSKFNKLSEQDKQNLYSEFQQKLAQNNPNWLSYSQDKRNTIFPYLKSKYAIILQGTNNHFPIIGQSSFKVYNLGNNVVNNIDEEITENNPVDTDNNVEDNDNNTKNKNIKNNTRFYKGDITPDKNTIFVFGSNPEGRHGLGAAKIAKEQFGAIYGQGEGLQGNSYALPTKDLRIKDNNSLKSIDEQTIINSIKKLYEVARQNKDKNFKIAYRNTYKKSLNGYTGLEMIDMFNKAGKIPNNIIFSEEWADTGKINNVENNNDNTTTVNETNLEHKYSIPMNFEDGSGGRKMRDEFKGKSTLELIKEGNRTATSRDRSKSYNQQNIKEGDIIKFYADSGKSKGDSVLVRVTKAPYNLSEVTAEEWSKLEGWNKDRYETLKNQGYQQFQFELLNPITKSNNTDLQLVINKIKGVALKSQLETIQSFLKSNPEYIDKINKESNKIQLSKIVGEIISKSKC